MYPHLVFWKIIMRSNNMFPYAPCQQFSKNKKYEENIYNNVY